MEILQEKFLAKDWLENYLAKKIEKNPRYSLRAFATRVSINPSVLSRILTGKRTLTFKMAVRIADALALEPCDRSELLSITVKTPIKNQSENEKEMRDLSVDCFMAMSDWYHYAICQLLYVENFKEDNKWIAKTLGVSELEVKLAISRLLRLNILERDENDILFRTSSHFQTTTDVLSSGLRKFQKQILERAIVSLDDDPLLERDITSITMAINVDKVAEAKLKIKEFRQEMADFLEEGPRSRVYNLGVHLVPLSK